MGGQPIVKRLAKSSVMPFSAAGRGAGVRRAAVVAVALALLVLGAQLLAESPWHRDAYASFGGQPAVGAEVEFCPLCILAFHSPIGVGSPATPALAPPPAPAPAARCFAVRRPLFVSGCGSRAPPALV